ncbi:MAG: trehalose-phosphatase [Woeseia sp.]
MTRPPSPDIANHHWAWFLDVDGTLLEIEKHPQLVTADNRLLYLLESLDKAYDGAVALISGRSLEQLDGIFNGLGIAAAASHGLEQRLRGGNVLLNGQDIPSALAERVTAFAQQHEGLTIDRKPVSIGIHYRARPELEETVLAAMEEIRAEFASSAKLMRGKMVVEILPEGADKGSAIRSFMQDLPFKGRLPVFVGDDVTDEHGFKVVNELGGMSVRIGHSTDTAAKWRLRNVTDLRTWLQSALDLL